MEVDKQKEGGARSQLEGTVSKGLEGERMMVYSVGERISVWLRCAEQGNRWDKIGKREEAKSCGLGKTFRFLLEAQSV